MFASSCFVLFVQWAARCWVARNKKLYATASALYGQWKRTNMHWTQRAKHMCIRSIFLLSLSLFLPPLYSNDDARCANNAHYDTEQTDNSQFTWLWCGPALATEPPVDPIRCVSMCDTIMSTRSLCHAPGSHEHARTCASASACAPLGVCVGRQARD